MSRKECSKIVLRKGFLILCGLAWGLIVWAQNPFSVSLVGIGGTFPQAIYSKWFEEFTKLHRGVDFHYLPQGSGQGIESITSGKTDYGGTDAPLTDKQLAEAAVKVLHFPTVVSGVVPIYNIPGVNDSVKFTPQALAGIYLGSVIQWNDPAIALVNPEIHFPASRIVVIHTANGRGTTYIWSDYLSKVSPEWRTQIGKGTSIVWPVGTAAEGNGNVAKMVKEALNSIGYVELPFAIAKALPYGSVSNAAGNFVTATLESVTAAAAAVAKTMHGDFRASLTNPPGAQAYPIASFTWILVPKKISDNDKRTATTQFLRWMLTEGQRYAKVLNYAPLPAELIVQELEAVDSISTP
jgi:phosphate transport system substrate-binding protein